MTETDVAMDEYKIVVSHLRFAENLAPAKLVTPVTQQLRAQGRQWTSPYRYGVEMEIVDARTRPAKDLDNYAKPIIDAVTQSRLLWKDDHQIDELIIMRRRDGNLQDSEVNIALRRIPGQHRGVPSHFRARCAEARGGTIDDYSRVGYYLATKLASEVPYDLEEDDWLAEIAYLVELVEADEDENVWIWFREHLPKFMVLVPIRHKMKFVSGVRQAHEDGRIES